MHNSFWRDVHFARSLRIRWMNREFALLRLDANKTLVRTLVDELASKYPCSPLAMCLVLPSGAFIDVLGTASKLLAAALV